MIIRRYLVKQVVSTSLVVTKGLAHFNYYGWTVNQDIWASCAGRLDANVLLSIIAYRLPEFLTLILPLGFFIGLMLVFGRLYVDHGDGCSKWQRCQS